MLVPAPLSLTHFPTTECFINLKSGTNGTKSKHTGQSLFLDIPKERQI